MIFRRGPGVVVDGSAFEDANLVGIWRYAYNLLDRVSGQLSASVWLRAPARMPLPSGVDSIRDRGRVLCRRTDLVGRVRRLAATARSRLQLRNARLFHSLVYAPPPVAGLPLVVTVYDMMHEL